MILKTACGGEADKVGGVLGGVVVPAPWAAPRLLQSPHPLRDNYKATVNFSVRRFCRSSNILLLHKFTSWPYC